MPCAVDTAGVEVSIMATWTRALGYGGRVNSQVGIGNARWMDNTTGRDIAQVPSSSATLTRTGTFSGEDSIRRTPHVFEEKLFTPSSDVTL